MLTPRVHLMVSRPWIILGLVILAAAITALLVLVFQHPNDGILYDDPPGKARVIIATGLSLGLLLITARWAYYVKHRNDGP